MPAKLLKQIRTCRQTIQQVIRLDAATGTVGHIAIDREHHARPVNPFGNLRRGDPDDAAMPAGTFNHRDLSFSILAELRQREIDNLLLYGLALLVARIEM